jgi:fucose permease
MQLSESNRILAFIYSLAFVQGLTIMLMPPLFRSIGTAFAVGMAMQGQLQSAFYFGVLITGLIGGVLFERFGAKWAASAAILLVGVGALVIGTSTSHLIAIVGALFFGMGNGWMTVVFGAAVAHRFDEKRQKIFTWAMLWLATGGIIGPYLLSYLLRLFPWRLVLVSLGLLLSAAALVLYVVRTPVIAAIRGQNQDKQYGSLAVLREGRLWLTTALFLLHGVSGATLVAWVGRLYQEKLSIDDERAALLLSVNAGGFFVGRLILGTWLAGKLPDRVLLGLCAASGTLTYGAIILGESYAVALIAMICFGIAMSGDAPSIYSLVAKQFAISAGVAFAAVQAMGAVGSTMGPWLTGWLGEHYGLDRAIWFGPVFLSALAVAAFAWETVHRIQRRRAVAVAAPR